MPTPPHLHKPTRVERTTGQSTKVRWRSRAKPSSDWIATANNTILSDQTLVRIPFPLRVRIWKIPRSSEKPLPGGKKQYTIHQILNNNNPFPGRLGRYIIFILQMSCTTKFQIKAKPDLALFPTLNEERISTIIIILKGITISYPNHLDTLYIKSQVAKSWSSRSSIQK